MLNVSKSLTILLFSALATFAVGVPPQAALAASSCYKSHLVEDPFKSPMIRQWLQWETSVTLPDWSQERPISRLPIAQVSRQSVEVEALSKADILGLETIADSASSTVSWFKHPYNQNIKVPNFEAPVSGYGVAFHTASRTIVTKINSRLVSLKMPTDYPFGPSRHQQSEKIELHGDLKYSVARSKAILAIDNKIPEDPKLVIQKEIAAVIDKETRNGYLIRDMSALLDGHYYLPGHQLPYVGKVIAEKQGSDVATYWRQHWAATLGRSYWSLSGKTSLSLWPRSARRQSTEFFDSVKFKYGAHRSFGMARSCGIPLDRTHRRTNRSARFYQSRCKKWRLGRS